MPAVGVATGSRKFARRNRRDRSLAAVGRWPLSWCWGPWVRPSASRGRCKRERTAEPKATDKLKRNLETERVDAYFHRIALAYRELSADNLGAPSSCSTSVRKTCAGGNGITSNGSAGSSR